MPLLRDLPLPPRSSVALALALALATVAGNARAAGPAAGRKNLSLTTQVVGNSSLHRFDDPDHSASTDLWLSGGVKPAGWGGASLGAQLFLSQALTQERKTAVTRTRLTARTAAQALNPLLKASFGGFADLPFTAGARAQESLYLSTTLSPRLEFDLAPARVPVSGRVQLDLTRKFHEFTVATTGDSNIQYAAAGTFLADLNFTDHLYAELTLYRSQGWSYAGSSIPQFDFTEELGWKFDSGWAAAVGLDTSGSAIGPRGRDDAMSFYNPHSSTVYATVSYDL